MPVAIIFFILFSSFVSYSQGHLQCAKQESEISLLKSDKLNAQLSRDNCYEAICKNTKTLNDFKEEVACKRDQVSCRNVTEKSIQLHTQEIEDILIHNFKQLQAMIPDFIKELDSSQSQKVAQEDKLTINLDWFLDKKNYFDEEDVEHLTQIKDLEKLQEKYYEITDTFAGPNEIKWMIRMLKNRNLNKITTDYKNNSVSSSGKKLSSLMTIKEYFPNNKTDDSTRKFIKMALKKIQSLASTNKTYFKDLLETPVIKRLELNQYSENELDKLIKEFKYASMVETIESDSRLLQAFNDRETSNSFTYKNKSNLTKLFNELPKADLTRIKKRIQKSLKYCQESLNIAYASAIPQEQHDRNIKKINKAKDKIVSAFYKSYSKESTKSIAKQLNSISFDVPLSRKDLQREINLMQKTIRFNEYSSYKNRAQRTKYKLAKLAQNISDAPDISLEDIQDSILDIPADRIMDSCHHISSHNFDTNPSYTEIDDHTHTAANYIKVSPFTFNNLDQNMGIVYHEIGHNIDHFIRFNRKSNFSHDSLTKHNIQIKCLSEQSKRLNTDQISDESKLKKVLKISFVGEDYADLVSAVFHKEQNLACPLTQSFKGLKLPPNYQFLAPNRLDDNHSNAFYRLLNIEKVRKGKLPKQCSDFLEHHTNNLQVKDCLKNN